MLAADELNHLATQTEVCVVAQLIPLQQMVVATCAHGPSLYVFFRNSGLLHLPSATFGKASLQCPVLHGGRK